MPYKFHILVGFYVLLLCFSCESDKVLVDARDGQKYHIKKLKDGKYWMTQNLNYKVADSWCLMDQEKNGAKLGRLYTWEAAKVACPEGWHLPSDDEWWQMTSFYGKAYSTFFGKSDNGTFQKDKKNNKPGAGNEAIIQLKRGGSSGLELQFGGYRFDSGKYYNFDNIGMYWTSSEYLNSGTGWYYFLLREGKIHRNYGRNHSTARSCRCVRD